MKNCYLLCIRGSSWFSLGNVYRIKNNKINHDFVGGSETFSVKRFDDLEQLNENYYAQFVLYQPKYVKVLCLCGREMRIDELKLNDILSSGKQSTNCKHLTKIV